VSANKNLGKVGHELGLDQCIQQSLTNLQGVSPDTMADTFKAIAGAVWLDCGKKEAVIEKLLRSMGIMAREAE
jgi:dsRNA-specific ribonuclease